MSRCPLFTTEEKFHVSSKHDICQRNWVVAALNDVLEAGCNVLRDKTTTVIHFSDEENRYLAARFLESYDDYYGNYNPKISKFALKKIKDGFHQKWAEEFSTRGPYKRTPVQVYDRLRKMAVKVRDYIRELKRYKAGEIDVSELPPMKHYLHRLVPKICEHEQRLYKHLYPYLHDNFDEEMPMDDSPLPDETDAFAACSSSGNEHGMENVLFLPDEERKASAEEPAALPAQDIMDANTPLEQSVVLFKEETTNVELSVDEVSDFSNSGAVRFKEETTDVKLPLDKAVAFRQLTANGVETDPYLFIPRANVDITLCPTVSLPPPNRLCEGVRRLTTKRLTVSMGTYNIVCGTTTDTLGIRAKVVVRRVRQFFEELKKLLGDSCKRTILDSPVEMTAMACGVSQATVRGLGVRSEFVHELFPRSKKKVILDRELVNESTLQKYGEKWGKIVGYFIREKLKKENMTINALHKLLRDEYANFPMSRMTLYRFTKGMGVTYGRKRGISYMLL
ncbi:hypothetical protein ANCCAN_07475 [Ancylostoma caninum]|uniref:Uncharacterized protein n=1 Tax=Ancylostoma caninum TaxID=29170 RepID=A0A368GQ26_ANCCA|nr:hypothetical protein ANCCAN_07475 [Ancylostoma caninum]